MLLGFYGFIWVPVCFGFYVVFWVFMGYYGFRGSHGFLVFIGLCELL